MADLKKLTILHSNDMHGAFLEKEVDGKTVGGISMLSGYISKVRRETENALYVIAGDMFRGSVIDSDYKGVSTIELVNMLAPDVVTLGNHEVDYGLAHLLFLEKCASFPIINANMYITTNFKRIFNSHLILKVDGMNILFIGILTEEVMASTKNDKYIGSLVDVKEAVREVGKICNSYKTIDIDFTVLLTHIGLEHDIELAKNLDPRWGVDLIIGAHSHTFMEEPIEVNGIPITQAGEGTSQIGRFDILVNKDTNDIHEYTWELVPINEDTATKDFHLDRVVNSYKEETDRKYSRVITRFKDVMTHPNRHMETELGKLFADAMKESLGVDIALPASGSIRKKELGPIILHKDLLEVYPFDDAIFGIYVNGAQLRKMMLHLFREDFFLEISEFYQFSQGLKVEYNKEINEITRLLFEGRSVKEDDVYTIALQEYHYNNLDEFFNLTVEEISIIKKPKVLTTSGCDLMEEYFSTHEMFKAPKEKRLTIV